MELLDLALSLEYDLQGYYRKQAELNEGNSVQAVFTLLQKEEEKHAMILKSYADKIELPLTDSNILSEVQAIFKDLPDFKSEIKIMATQLDVYRLALEKEEQSKEFYQELFDRSSQEQSKKVFGYLINQEDKHCVLLEEFVKRVSRPEEWVESAEFTFREPY
ncbi:ferritin family protein [Mobilitalea sibirica]|uniref:Ferritin family protein n=1 Tax=Mobilitalea sibirica TaxID=1462919 RepID=A0A8J7HA50_9FIRM|nr:ferritin family protein [Mobilitalea sibirica]MBH1939611.1 ferritin family protein [Mobilitalea sibirica]